jgi:hypothetical protein
VRKLFGEGEKPAAPDRRQYLTGLTAVGTFALAGCLARNGGEEEEEDDGEDYEDVEEERQLNGRILRSSFPMQLYEFDTDNRVAEVHYHTEFSHWHYVALEIPLDDYRPLDVRIYTADDEVLALGEDERFHLQITRTEGTPADLVDLEISGSLVNFHGTTAGEGKLLFHLMEDDETLWTTPPLTVMVGNPDETGANESAES